MNLDHGWWINILLNLLLIYPPIKSTFDTSTLFVSNFWCHVKNWLTFLNLNLYKNQNIVSSWVAITSNCNKSKPEFAHVNAEILLDAKTMQYRHTHHVC